jgi:hypothetical protein
MAQSLFLKEIAPGAKTGTLSAPSCFSHVFPSALDNTEDNAAEAALLPFAPPIRNILPLCLTAVICDLASGRVKRDINFQLLG